MSINRFIQPGSSGGVGGGPTITSGNVVVGAGRNEDGWLGTNTTSYMYTWTQEHEAFENVTRATCNHENASLICSGVMYVAGDATYQQLNRGNTTRSITFIELIGGGSGCIDGSAGYNCFHVIKDDGTLWGIGYNYAGKLGNGNTTNQTSLVQEASGFTDWEEVNVGYGLTGALRNSGDLYIAGYYPYGQAGNGTTGSDSSFVYSTGNVAKFVNGAEESAILTTDGKIYTAGRNLQGQLGIGNVTQTTTWTQEASGFTWIDVSITNGYDACMLAIRDDGSIWGWGNGNYSKIGLNNYNNYNTPQLVTTGNFVSVHAGDRNGAAIDDQGRLWYWGDDQGGQDGTDSIFTPPNAPTMIEDGWQWVSLCEAGGRDSMMGIVKKQLTFNAGEGMLYGVGTNYGQIGDDTKTQRKVWTTENNKFTQISHLTAGHQHAGFINNGIAYVAGESNYYQTNQGNTTDVEEYVEFIGGGSGCIDFNCGYHSSHVIKSDGTLWAIGYGYEGRLGVGDSANKTVLTQESSGWTDWTRVWSSFKNTGALRGNDLYVCGDNTYYQLGVGDNTDRNTFVYSTGNVTKFQSSETSCLILTTDGKIYGVGQNEHGELGVGDQVQRNSWTQETLGYTWTDFAMCGISTDNRHVAAIRDDGSVWGWGYSSASNENGDASRSDTNTPTEIIPSGSGNFISVGTHLYGGYAIDDQNRLWFWGNDNAYQDGDGDTTDTELQLPRLANDKKIWLMAEGGTNWGLGVAQ